MQTVTRTATALAATILFSATAEAAAIKIATWNLNNLHHVIGEPLRDRAPARSQQDYATLREYRDRIGADIYALQEVNGPKAAALVFPPAARPSRSVDRRGGTAACAIRGPWRLQSALRSLPRRRPSLA
jgi:hypothetical protein